MNEVREKDLSMLQQRMESALAMLAKDVQERSDRFEALAAKLGYEYSQDAKAWLKIEHLQELRRRAQE